MILQVQSCAIYPENAMRTVCRLFFLLHSNMYLEALALVKVKEYYVNMFIEINYTDKNTQSIAYNIYSEK